MIWSKQRFQHSFELFPRVLREVIPLLLPLSAILWGLDYFVSVLNKSRFENPYDSSVLLLISAGVGAVILESLITVVWLILVAKSTQKQMKNGVGPSSFKFLTKNFHQVLIEYIRALISTSLYSLFFLIPGVVRWVKLTFTCYISSFDPQYHEGSKDALESSSHLVKGRFIPLLFLLVFQMIFPFMIEEFAKSASLGSGVTYSLFIVAWLLNLYFAIYLALTYFAVASYKLGNP